MNARGEEVALALREPRIAAFLKALRYGEGTADADGYRRHFGGELFESFDAHPRKAITKRLGGKEITSTAAGAYQFLSRTWSECKGLLELPDFTPASQDVAAAFLVRGAGAFPDLRSGNVAEAAARCAGIWASLPTSPYGQPTVSQPKFLAVYAQALAELTQGTPNDPPAAAPQEPAEPATDPEPDNTPTPEPTMPLPALILPLVSAVIEAFSPLAREKISREMSKHTDKPEIAEQIATGVMQAVQLATGVQDPIQAVAAVKADRELLDRAEAAAVVNVDKLLGVLERVTALDQKAIADARTYNAGERFIVDTRYVKFKFVELLSLLFVGFSGWFVVQNWGSLTPELKGAIITLMIIAGWNGVRDFWMGSSSGSESKTAMLMQGRDGKG